jgi:hypothetical protein
MVRRSGPVAIEADPWSTLPGAEPSGAYSRLVDAVVVAAEHVEGAVTVTYTFR